MKLQKKGCKTCIYSRWNLTETGLIRKGRSGKCVAPIPPIVLPDSVLQGYGFNMEFQRSAMRQDEGTNCAAWQENQGKPIAIGKE